jgi:hypothetical protein
MKTIRRNSLKKIKNIISNASELKYYTLSNDFNPQTSVKNKEEIESIITSILKDRVSSIREEESGIVVFTIHSNFWIEILPSEAA